MSSVARRAGEIYSIPCKDCDKLYIGEAKRKFNSRLREHQKAVEQKHPEKSALAEHCLQSGHTVPWESSTTLRTNSSWRTRRLLEAWEINTCKNPLKRDDGMYLPKDYRALTLLDKNLLNSSFYCDNVLLRCRNKTKN